jgi:hypothetical protein
MSGTGLSVADRPNGSKTNNQISEPTEPTAQTHFATVLGMNPALASLSASPLAQSTGPTGPTGLTLPTFNLFSTPPHTHPMNSSLGVGALRPGADPAALVAAVHAARASVEAAAGRPAMATAFPGSTPAAEFKENIRLALEEHLPRLEALALAVIEGMYVHSSLSSTPKSSGPHRPFPMVPAQGTH